MTISFNLKKLYIPIFLLIISLCEINAQKVLFMGNSIFYLYNVPSKFDSISNSCGKNIKSIDISKGGYSIKYHLSDSTSLRILKSCKWDYIILLGFNSSRPFWGIEDIEKKYKKYYNKLVVIEPYSSFIPKSFRKPEIVELKNKVKKICDKFNSSVILVPFGEILDCILDQDPNFEFSEDFIHLNNISSYLLAKSIYKELFVENSKSFKINNIVDSLLYKCY